MHSDARISDCDRYRYWLSRIWDDDQIIACFIMLNPSTADATRDDPTVRRCMNFARAWGMGGVYVVNLFALRATDPRELLKADDPVGPDNDHVLVITVAPLLAERPVVVAAWGARGALLSRDQKVLAALRKLGVRVQCLGVTAKGHPRHPLYVGGNTPLMDFPQPTTQGKESP